LLGRPSTTWVTLSALISFFFTPALLIHGVTWRKLLIYNLAPTIICSP
jgi:hypothetical protein